MCMLSADTEVSRDSRLEVDDAAVRRGLSLWLEGALAFHTSKQVNQSSSHAFACNTDLAVQPCAQSPPTLLLKIAL